MVPDPSDRWFAEAVARRGWLTPAQVDDALRARDAAGATDALPDWLVARGLLTRERTDQLRRDPPSTAPSAATIVESAASATPVAPAASADQAPTLATAPASKGDGAATLLTSPPGASPSGGVPATGPPAGRLGKYDLLEEVGRGGMGVVYRAFDTELRREVALKTVLVGDAKRPELVERLRREARTAATLDHPGIVPIYDVGAADGVPYFAMAFLRGRTFDVLLREGGLPGLRERVAVLVEVARAVAHAHDRQVVHRDLKPSNLLVDLAGGIHVMDFGLAKRLDDDLRLTATGQLMGTPQYMSPEQLEGEGGVGAPSDVYSLGAVLYEALSGRPPFPGNTMAEIVARSLARDPEPPRRLNPRVPLDLETVCLKALEKEPARRYPTARELAADLTRWLAGEAIEARPATWRTTIVRRIVRRKALTAAVVAFAVAGLALAVSAGSLHSRARLQERVLESLREKAGLYVDAALALRRVGVPRAMRKAEEEYLPRLRRAVEEAEREQPDLAEPRYHLGRLCRALMRFDEAAREQEAALARDPDCAPARYERAVLAIRAHADRLALLRERALQDAGSRLRQGESTAIPTDLVLEACDDEARRLRAQIVADLERLARNVTGPAVGPGSGATAASGTPGDAAARSACVQGLALIHGGRTTEDQAQGRALLARALELEPTLEEAWESWAALEEALGNWTEAEAVFGRALESDRGYTPFWYGRSGARLKRGVQAGHRGLDPTPFYDGAAADLDRVGELEPDRPEPWTRRAMVWIDRGVWLGSRGADAASAYREAIADYGRALALAPDSADSWGGRGVARLNLGVQLEGRGEDGSAVCVDGITDVGKAISLAPARAEFHLWLGAAHINAGSGERRRGRDSEPHFREAVAAIDRGLALDPVRADLWLNRGVARGNLAEALAGRGEDPEQLCAAAVADLARAREIDPVVAHAWLHSGLILNHWGVWRAARGLDAGEKYRVAAEHLDQAVAAGSGDAEALSRRASVSINWAVLVARGSGDSRPHLERALADLDRALEINANDPETWTSRANARTNRAAQTQARGEDPADDYARAIADLGRALDLNPVRAETWERRGEARSNWAVYRSACGEDVRSLLDDALADLLRATELDPRDPETWDRLGAARMNRADTRTRCGEDATEDYRQAVADLERGIALQDRHAMLWCHLGQVLLLWGVQDSAFGRDPGAVYGKAMDALARAVELNPAQPEAWLARGLVHGNLALWREGHAGEAAEENRAALADLDRALEIAPGLEDAVRHRGWIRTNEASRVHRAGGDAEPLYRAAVGDFDRALELNPGMYRTYVRRAEARTNLGIVLLDRKRDADEFFRAAYADLERAMQLNPNDAEAWWRKGWVLYVAQQWGPAIECFEKALQLTPASAPSYAAQLAEARARLAGTAGPLDQLASAGRLIQERRYQAARAEYEAALQALEAVPAEGLPAEPIRVAHYNLACVYALTAAGLEGESPPAAPEAARLRDAAFDQLARAVQFGWADRRHTEKDPDLESLRADARWAAFVEKLR